MKLRATIAVFYAVLLLAIMVPACSTLALGQGPADLSAANPPEPSAPPSPAPLPDAPSAAQASDGWRGMVSIYGWFPGVHGTTGIADKNISVHAPFSDVFHVLKGIIPIAVELDKKRFVMPLDFFWVKLGDDRAVPENDAGQTSANLHLTQSIFTPKFGYRILDGEHLKIDALGGIRYWHVGQEATLEPSGVSRSASANWVDGLGGMRFILPLGEKASFTASGDVGAGGASLDYQGIGLLMYNFTPKLGLGLGWRYLDVDYRDGDRFLFDIAQSGALAGMYFNFGGKPAPPVAASCSVSPSAVWSGDPVSATISTQNFNPKHTLTYSWSSTGAKISGSGTTANVDTTGLAPGTYSVKGTATDAKEKKNNVATCNASFTIKQPQPPVVSCTANPTTLAINEPATVTMTATDPQGWPLTYSWTNSGGQFSGSGTSATVTATSADAGNTITVTGTATDARANLSASCNASITVPRVQSCVTIADWGECTFEKNPKKPWRVDNDCKDTLDKLALRVQQMPNGKLNIVGYTNEEESVSEQTLGDQRSVNVKYYLTTDGPTKLDASRIQPRKGTNKAQATHFYFVPEGNLCGGQLEEGVVVDESQVQPQSRTAPAPAKKK